MIKNSFDFGVLTPYIKDENITDINYNGKELWIDDLVKGRYVLESFQQHDFMNQICFKLANYTNLPFNATFPIVESETDDLRISIIHHSVARSGNSISIRKTPALMRLNDTLLLKQNYATKDVLMFLKQCVEHKCNVMVSGLPGCGKTELIKYLTNFIDGKQRVITIEDTLEMRYGDIHPHKDCVMLKVNEHFNYNDAIKASLRQRPDWILVSEVRSHEVVQLLQSVSTGAKLLSTIHADQAILIPKRILHMFPGVELTNQTLLNMIYEVIDIGIHLESSIDSKGIHRYIREICYFYVDVDGKAKEHIIYRKNIQEVMNLPSMLQNKWEKKQKKRKVE